MNLDMFVQKLVTEVAQTVSTAPGTDSSQDSEDFESMLVQQSKDARAQRAKERPAEKPEPKKQAEKPKQNSTQEEETPKDGSQLAAALVTSQPVVLFGVETVNAGEVQAGPTDEVMAEMAPASDAGAGILEEVTAEPRQEAAPAAAAQAELGVEALDAPAEEAPVEEIPAEQPEQDVRAEMPEHQEVKVQAGRSAEEQPVDAGEDQPEEIDMQEAWTGTRPVFRSNDAMPEKVGENYETLAPEAEDAPQKLAATLTQALEQGQSRVSIQLTPANLGQLTVEITRDADGALSVVLSTVNEKAAAILRQHSGALQNAMMGSAQAPVTVEVQQPQQAEEPNQFLNPDGQNNQNQRQQQRQEQKNKGSNEDFLQQLRLGLVGLNQD